ncbi:MAG: malonic semialdehyde reductase [Rhodospirillaceae bacterium]|nr:malonic semialdehyde reductase [Rhodospirillaceae bacterium]|tara:strand:+ start:1105 stop:1758 length:654 start_codon:yes stop_codon:yes gene_type:complete
MSDDAALEVARAKIEDYRNRIQSLDGNSRDLLFCEARNHNWWQDRDVSDDQLQEAFELARMGPTSANTQPMRITFVRTKEAKERLNTHVNGPNQNKTMLAPVTAIVAYDNTFFTDFSKFNPIRPEMADRFSGNAEMAESFSRIQAILQGGYFIMALRAVGLDVGAMGGFNNAGVDEEFFSGTAVKSIFLCNIGYGDVSGIKGPRLYRYGFEEVCEIV